jgi:hypothetical protein
MKITQEVANEAQGETEAIRNGQQRRAILNVKRLVADSARLGVFFSFMEQNYRAKKSAFRTGAAPFYFLRVFKMATARVTHV